MGLDPRVDMGILSVLLHGNAIACHGRYRAFTVDDDIATTCERFPAAVSFPGMDLDPVCAAPIRFEIDDPVISNRYFPLNCVAPITR